MARAGWLAACLLAGCARVEADDGVSETDAPDTGGEPTPTGTTGGTVTSGEALPCRDEPIRDGIATWYEADGAGACGFEARPDDPLLVAAMNLPEWDGSGVCGACVHVVGPRGEVTVEVVDQCPGCAAGHVDLSPDAFERLAPLGEGRIDVTWRYVACDADRLTWAFASGSSEWWMAVIARDPRYAVATLEVRREGAWEALPRTEWNTFVGEGLGPGPFDLRATDVNGQAVEDEGVPLVDGGEVRGDVQFPECTPSVRARPRR